MSVNTNSSRTCNFSYNNNYNGSPTLARNIQLVTPASSIYARSTPSSPFYHRSSPSSPISPVQLSRAPRLPYLDTSELQFDHSQSLDLYSQQGFQTQVHGLSSDYLSRYDYREEEADGLLPGYSPYSARSLDMDNFPGMDSAASLGQNGLGNIPPLLPSKPPRRLEPNLFDSINLNGFQNTHNVNRSSIGSFDTASVYASDRDTIYSSEMNDYNRNPFLDDSSEEDEQVLRDLEASQLISVIELSKIETKFERDGFFKSDYILPDRVSEIINSRKNQSYNMNFYNGKQWDEFWKLNDDEHKILEDWNPEICERQGTLFEIIVRLQKFRFHLSVITNFYGEKFKKSTSLKYHSKLKREFKKWFPVLNSLYKYTSNFFQNLIQSHFDGKLLANDSLILPMVLNYFKHISDSFNIYSVAFGYLKIFFAHDRVKRWVTEIDGERPKEWKKQHDIVSSNELFQSYFWLTFSGVKPLFEKLVKIYDLSGNQILFCHGSNILAELKRINRQANDKIEIYENYLKKKTSAHK